MKRYDCIDVLGIVAFCAVALVFVSSVAVLIWPDRIAPNPQTVLNLDEMARKWNATPTYFLATSNHVTVQDTTSYGVTTLRIDPPTQAMEDFPPPPSLQRTGPK